MRFVCAKPLDFVNLGLSSLATEHLTLRRSGGEGGGDWGGFSRQSSLFTLLKHHSEGCHKLQFTGNHFWELMVKVSKTIMRNNTKGQFCGKSF